MNIDTLRAKYDKVKEVARKKRDSLTSEQLMVLRDMLEANKDTGLQGLAFYRHVAPFIEDAYITIVKGKSLSGW